MKTTAEFLAYLCSLDIKLWVDSDRLRCNAPKNALTPDIKAELAKRKAEILAFICQTNLAASSTSPSIQPVPRQGNLPLSFSQQRLWFFDQFEPGTSLYNIPTALYIKGWLNVPALLQTLNEIVRRHEALRTTFASVEGQPVQVISFCLTLTLPIVNLEKLPKVKREVEVQKLIANEAQQPFNLATGPLLRCTLLRLTEEEHVLMFTMHHIVSDGWSMGILIQEVAALYEAFSQGQPLTLPELPIQYADFAVWQRQWLQGEVLEAQLAYWKKQLGGSLPVLQLPTRPRPKVQTFRGATQSFSLSANLTEALKTLSRNEDVTLFMTLLAAFKTLLYRYSGQDDILVGSAIANRNRKEIESLIGFFVNTLVLRTNLSNNPTFRELLGRVRETTLAAYAHQDVPFEQLVEELQPPRDTSHTPVFQVMFVLQNAPKSAIELPGLTVSLLETNKNTTNFDLTLNMEQTGDSLVGILEYNTDLFDASTISRMVGHLQTLLEGIVINPNQRLWQLSMLTPVEQHQLLVFNQNQSLQNPTSKIEQCIHQLFEEQVERFPGAIAVVFKDEYLTYRELNSKANQLAHYLQKVGVGPEVRVGICVERSLEMVIGVLAILKAGGAYVPLDPAYPSERLTFMLQNAQVSVLLTQKQLWQGLPVHQAQIIHLDTDWEQIAQLPQSNPVNSQLQPENLAYIIYTSGSTGKSKGVMIEHSSLVNAYFAWEKIYQLRTNATCHLQMASFSFDVFSGDLIRALCSGRKLVLCPRDLLLSPQELYSLMRKEKVDCAEFVPVVLRNLIQYLDSSQQRLDFMRLLICGSDSWSGGEYQNFLRFCSPQTRLINSFGLTEATIDSSYFETTAKNLPVDQLVPIGRSFPNTELYILDKHLQPVPIGVPGELYISGVGLARGYINRPELTAEKFIPNPFERSKFNRLYKTGDLVRYLSDGNIEFLKRIDYQVKIRGFRIEIGEIEATITQHPAVREAAIALREEIPGDKRLVAYVVPLSADISALVLRSFLKAKLPDYMIPAFFVMLQELPLTPNGKIDRRALPTPDTTQLQLEEKISVPLTLVEEMLAGIWAEVLGIKKVGIHNNFFELGGHSLLATRVISHIRKALKVELPLRCLFESPTVAELAKEVERTTKAGLQLELPTIEHVSRLSKIPLSFAQQRLWFLEQLQPNNTAYNIFDCVRVVGSLNIPALQESLNEIVRRHEILRTTFTVENGQPVQIIAPTLTLTVPVVDLSQFPDPQREAQKLGDQEAEKPFALDRDPLLRVTLLQLGKADYVVVLTMHHIISDGWSTGVLIQELAALYEAFCLGKPSPLPKLPIQYADFAVWQRQWLQQEVLETQLTYWKQQLQDLPILRLPTDRPRPALPTYQGARQSFNLSKTLSKELKTLSSKQGVTLFMTLLAAFATLLHYYSEQDDIVIGTDVANRNQAETEGLIGFFVNQMVLRTYLAGNPNFAELLQRIRGVTLEAYAHQDLPFDKLVEALNPERDLNLTPLFQVKLILQNIPTESLELPGLTLTTLELESKTATFDLLLELRDREPGITGLLKYNTDLFDASSMTRMLENLETILRNVATQPTVTLSELKAVLVRAEKKQQIVKEQAYQNTLQQKLMSIKRKSISS